jgi:hypothetical protein
MKWYKHDSDASNDAKVKKLILRHGAEGYAVYFHCLELIAGNVTSKNITFELEHDNEIIADNLKFKGDETESGIDKVNRIMKTIIDLNLLTENNGSVFCFKLLNRLDETTSKNPQIRALLKDANKLIGNMSGDNRENVGITPTRKEENRINKNRKEKNTITAIVFPDSLNNDVFKETWNDWIKYKKERQDKLTDSTMKRQLNKLSLSPSNAIAIINQSIDNGWSGLFDLKKGKKTDSEKIQDLLNTKDLF